MTQSSRRAFTLVELLVVIGIIAVLISILLPAVNRARMHAQLATELSNARQFAIANIMYAGENRGSFPAARRNGWSHDDYVQYPIWAWDSLSKFNMGLPFPGPESNRAQWAKDNAETLIKRGSGCVAWQERALETGSPIPGQRMNQTNVNDWQYWNTELHWNVLIGRGNANGTQNDYTLVINPVPPQTRWFQSIKRLGTIPQDGTWTMFTCRHYATNQSWGGNSPHPSTNRFVTVATGQQMTPKYGPVGLTVGYLDGSARFVAWGELSRLDLRNTHTTWIYYDASR